MIEGANKNVVKHMNEPDLLKAATEVLKDAEKQIGQVIAEIEANNEEINKL